jgi:hypothetical protein
LKCNQTGCNVVICSAHGSYTCDEREDKRIHHRHLQAFDGEINLGLGVRKLKGKLSRTFFVIDSCEVGTSVASFRAASDALGALGFSEAVDWVDSTVFVLALLLQFQQAGVFHHRDGKKTSSTQSRVKRTIRGMKSGSYASLMNHLGIEFSLRR